MKLLYTLIILFAFSFAEDKLNIKDKTWSAQAGFGTRQSLGTFGISKDFKITDKISPNHTVVNESHSGSFTLIQIQIH